MKEPKGLTVGFVRDHPKREHSIRSQRDAMARAGIERVYTDWQLLLRQRRKGTGDRVAVKRLHLLADPARKRQRGGLRQSLYDAIDAIEAAGAVIVETDTGRTSADKLQRDAMIREAVDELAHSRVSARKIGRPAIVWTPEQITIMRLHWQSRRHPTDNAARAAIIADGVPASMQQIRKVCGKSGRPMGPKKSNRE